MHGITEEQRGRGELRCSRPTVDTLRVELSGSWRLQDEFPSLTSVEQHLAAAPRAQRSSPRLRATIARVQQVVDGDVVRLLQDTNKTLQEFSGAARSVRVLADYLERNPDSVLYGKSGGRR